MELGNTLGWPAGSVDRPEHHFNDFFFWTPALRPAPLSAYGLLLSPPVTPPPVQDDFHILPALGRLGQELREIGARPRDNDAHPSGPARRILPASERADEK